MSSNYDDQKKKRPPPIKMPPVPPPDSPQARRGGKQQVDSRKTSSSTQPEPRSAGSTHVSATSSHGQSGSYLPRSQSQVSKSNNSAKTTFSNLMVQARGSPRKSELGSTTNSRHGSTTRSRHSERSHQSAASAQAMLEALDEETSRGKIESQHEQRLFKMTGQLPPTPTIGTANEDDVYIRTEDLRAQCRAASGEKQAASDEPLKSPKKKIFGNMQMFNPFNRTANNTPAPTMSSKAAQVLGTSERKPHVIKVRPIKPSQPYRTPTRVPRSDTSKSLPGKAVDPHGYARRHYSGSSRRNRTTGGRSGRDSKQSLNAENTPPMPENPSFESVPPPTPPAKDTPPEFKAPPSPLRRALPSEDLRESYEAHVDKNMKLHFPQFALSPSPSKTARPGSARSSPTKFRSYTAEDYTKLIEGEPLQWHYPEEDGSSDQQGSKRSAPLANEKLETLQLHRPDRTSDRQQYDDRDSRRWSVLPPRFYSPSNRSVRLFTEGETPSKNTNADRLLFSPPSKAKLLHLREDSNNGSIEMIFQGNPDDIDPRSSTGQLLNDRVQNMTSSQARDNTRLATRVMQELQINEPNDRDPQKGSSSGLGQPEPSSSRLTDMFEGLTPQRAEFSGNFQPNFPSAVPSPLNTISDPLVQSQAHLIPVGVSPGGPGAPPRTPKTVEDHFFMTNEHLDVVAKTTWDLLEICKAQQSTTIDTKQEQLMGSIGKRIEGVKVQIDTANSKTDQAAVQTASIHTNLEQLTDFIKQDVMNALADQNKRTGCMETEIKELQKTVQALHKLLEQKFPEPKSTGQQHSATGTLPASVPTQSPYHLPTHRSQPSLAGYYGNTPDLSREGQPPMPPMPQMHDNRSAVPPQDSHNDLRAAYSNNYGQQWGGRTGYSGRGSKEERPPYSGANPYNYGNGGQFSNAYAGNYSPYNFSPSPPDQHYAFNQGPAK